MNKMHLSKGEEVESEKKPEGIIYYNSTKGGVDTMDQLVCGSNTKRIKRRKPMAIFCNTSMMEFNVVNVRILYLFLNQVAFGSRARPTRSSLLIQLGKELERYKNHQSSCTIDCQLGDYKDMPSSPPQKKQCYVCPSKKDIKSKTLCVQSRKNVSTEHSAVIFCQCRRL